MNSPQLKRSNSVELRIIDLRLMKNNLKTLRHQVQEYRERINAMAKDNRRLTTQLKKHHGNISKTADFIGMERSALHRKLKSLGIKGIN